MSLFPTDRFDDEFSRSPLLDALTDAQRAAVCHIDGPLLILAGPGSGKTRVVTHRVAWMLASGIHARQILALTFTNKAADEMRGRLERLAPRQAVWMGTFHRFCARMLRSHAELVGLRENFSIYDTDDSRKILQIALDEEGIDLTHTSPDAVAQAISWAKNNLVTADRYEPRRGNAIGGIVEKVYPTYQKLLLRASAVDFDDLLVHVAILLKENPEVRRQLDERYRYIMVDEYQDTNLAQYTIVRALSIDHPNLAVTGDPDQSIYGWRGANLSNILEFEKDYPSVKVVRLEQNYRSTKSILHIADQLIRHNIRRKEKDLFTDNPQGNRVRLATFPTQRDEAETIAEEIAHEVRTGKRRPRDFAIFYRTNALSRQIEHALREQVIPYQIVNGLEFYQRKEIKDVLSYLQLINNPRSDAALLRVINTPTRGIGKSTISKIQDLARDRAIPLLDAARMAGTITGLAKKSAVAVAKFVAMIDLIGTKATAAVEELVGYVLTETGYREVLENSEAEEDHERLANLEELLTAASEFDLRNPGGAGLEQFLEDSSLVADTDAFESESDKVTMMTLHAAKGLEFPAVYIVACEEGLLPHERSRRDEEKLEEERRLLFVGITRAMQDLTLCWAQYRMFRGQQSPTVASSFLMELPRHEMETVGGNLGRGSVPRYISWDDESQLPPDDDDLEFPPREKLSHDDAMIDPPLDEEISQLDPEELRVQQEKRSRTFSSGIVTAADLLAGKTSPGGTISPYAFKHGMMVDHPEYGPGQIVALSGNGAKRVANVRFLASGEEKKFVIVHSKLTPAHS